MTEQAAGLDFAHARQAVRISRWYQVKGRTASCETVHEVTDLDARAGPQVLNRLARQHWSIEKRQHYVRDVSQAEDACTTRAGGTPTNLATIRCAIINTLRRDGYQHIPEGRGDHTSPAAALALHGLA